MTLLTELFGGGGPIRTVEYTSGTGTYAPLYANAWIEAHLIGGGQGGGQGGSSASSGGNCQIAGDGGEAGAEIIVRMRVATSLSYQVGAPGAGANSATYGSAGVKQGSPGGHTRLGNFLAPGGGNAITVAGGFEWIPGGKGGFGSNVGLAPGAPTAPGSSTAGTGQGVGGTASGTAAGGGAGGDSPYGVGGNGSNGNPSGASSAGSSPAAGNYGAGGGASGGSIGANSGAGAAGIGGRILIKEYLP